MNIVDCTDHKLQVKLKFADRHEQIRIFYWSLDTEIWS